MPNIKKLAGKNKEERPEKKTASKARATKPVKKNISARKPSKKRTSRVPVQDMLLTSDDFYRFLVENMSDVAWRLSPDHRFTYTSPADEQMRGYPLEEVLGRSIFDFMTPVSARRVREMATERLERAKQGERLGKNTFEIEQVCKNGKVIWTEVISHPIYNHAGRLTGFHGVTRDITERKHQMLFESSGDALVTVTVPEYKFIRVNNAALRMFGVASEAAFCRLSPWDLSPQYQPDGRLSSEKAKEYMAKSMQEGSHCFEWLHQRVDGTTFFAEICHNRVKGYGREIIQASARDITERKRAEIALHESEELHRSILETAMDGLVVIDKHGWIIEVNQAYCRMSGYTEQELLRMSIYDLRDAEHDTEVSSRLRDVAAQGMIRFETVHRRKDGTRFTAEVSNHFLSLKGGRSIGFIRDITDRKRVEQALRASEELYSQILASSMDGVVQVGAQGKILAANKAYCTMSGYSEPELMAMSVFDLRAPEFHAEVETRIQETETKGVYGFESVHRRKDGSVFNVEVSNNYLPIAGGRTIGVIRDITERKKVQHEKERLMSEQLEEKQRHLTEREGLLMDLHDGVGGLVTNIRLLSEIAQQKSDKENIDKALAMISQLSRETMSEIRGLMQSLDSKELSWQNLASTVRQEGASLVETHGMQFTADIKVDAAGQPGSLLWANIMRIYKESLTNIVKHSHAKAVAVILNISHDKLVLKVHDDGARWNGQAQAGRGLAFMRKRAKDLEGSFTINSGEKGTLVSIEIPIFAGGGVTAKAR